MKKNIIIIIMILLNVYLLVSLNSKSENSKKTVEIISNLNNKVKSLEKSTLIRIKIEGGKINNDLVFIDLENNHYSPKTLLKNSSKFLFFSNENCYDCIDTEIKNLKESDSSSTKGLSIIKI